MIPGVILETDMPPAVAGGVIDGTVGISSRV
jgi:hypothetical protein